MEHTPNEPRNHDLLIEATQSVGCENIGETEVDQLYAFVGELLKWNQKSNLTGFSTEKEVIGNLIADSLAAFPLLKHQGSHSIIDIGSGGGIPGIPLKVVFPGSRVTLVEPNQKKVAFLRFVVGTLGLKNVTVAASRIEDIGKDDEYHGDFDCVVIKALRLESVLPYVNEVLSETGMVICWRVVSARRCQELFGFRVVNEVSHQLPFGFGYRTLSVLGRK